MENKTAETEKEGTSFENVKTINALIQGDNELSVLQKNIREAKRTIDVIFRDLKEIERNRQEQRRLEKQQRLLAEQKKLEEAKRLEEAKKPEDAQPSTEQPVQKPAVEKPQTVKPEVEAKRVVKPTLPPVQEKRMYTPPPPREPRTKQFQQGQGQGGQRAPYQQNRPPQQGNNQNRFNKPKPIAAPNIVSKPNTKVFEKKKDTQMPDEKKAMSKRTLIRKGFIAEDFGEERMGVRKLKNKKNVKQVIAPPIVIEKAVITTENLTVKLLSEKIGKPASEIIKKLMLLGIMTTINSVVDFLTMELVANELGVELELKLDKTKEEALVEFHEEDDDPASMKKRPPIVTVMGHVDHGKTSLLDAIRKTNVVTGEAGGITQHIGAYTITARGESITFIDTPGHEAFTAMRARGAKVTDIAILVVAADDGVMPQTIEAINHAKAANVPLVVAVNKMDKPSANPERVKQMLTEYGIISEEWGGDTMVVPVSAKGGTGIDKLLDSVLLLAEVMELKANPQRKAKGTVVEARLDKGKGPVATAIVQNGTLRVGDFAVSGTTYCRVRAMQDDKGRTIKEAGPSAVVSILGFSEVPNAGDLVYAVSDERFAKQIIDERNEKFRAGQIESVHSVSLDDINKKIQEGHLKGFNIIVKADTQGSVEALKASLNKLTNDEVKINTIHGGVGAINKSDIMLAEASGAIVIGFNVRPDNETRSYADKNKIDIRLYRIIYEAIEDIEAAMKGMLEPKFREQFVGQAEVRDTFKITGAGTIAGLMVTQGKLIRNAKVRVIRDNIVLYEGNISTLKRFKDDVKEVAFNYECGLGIEGFNDFKVLDKIECFSLERIE